MAYNFKRHEIEEMDYNELIEILEEFEYIVDTNYLQDRASEAIYDWQLDTASDIIEILNNSDSDIKFINENNCDDNFIPLDDELDIIRELESRNYIVIEEDDDEEDDNADFIIDAMRDERE